MATVPFSAGTAREEARFFFTMACIMSVVIVAGFAFNAAMGRSSFGAPVLVHVHAFVFMGWVGLYLAQNALIFSGNVALHRRLGWLTVILIPAMVVLGMLMTRYSLQTTGGPPFFDQNQFLVSNQVMLLVFAGLVGWAVAIRTNTGWHRRLMFTAFACLTGPGVGRLLPMPFLIPYGWWIASIALPLLFPIIGMAADKRRYGRVHPAWFWGVGIIVAMQVVCDLIAYSAVGHRITEWYVAGTPGGERQMGAFFPPM